MSSPQKQFSITHVVDVPSIKFDEPYTKAETHFNIPWEMKLQRNWHGISMKIACLKTYGDENWSMNTKLELSVISENGSTLTTSHFRPFINRPERKATGWVYPGLIAWKTLTEHFMVDNKVTFKVTVTILNAEGFGREKVRSFDKANEEFSDVVLVVEGEKFYVSKMFLASQSAYFKTLLMGNFNEAKQSEIPLLGVDKEDFQSYLELIHGESSLDDENIEGILHLADMYDTPTAIRRCEEFLIKESELSLVEKLKLASSFNLNLLKEKCFEQINSITEIDRMLTDDIFKSDPSIAVILLEKKLAKKTFSTKKPSVFSCFRMK